MILGNVIFNEFLKSLHSQEQRSIATKTNELQQDLNEHNIVIETLNGVDGDRKCFRLEGHFVDGGDDGVPNDVVLDVADDNII